MSRTIVSSTTVYKFSGLSDTAKQRAKDDHFAQTGYPWSSDAIKSLESLAEAFGATIKDYSIDYWNCTPSWIEFNYDHLDLPEIKERLSRLGDYNPETLKGFGDCKLTGYCADEDAIDGFRKAIHSGETDLGKLLQEAFRNWLKSVQTDAKWMMEDEQFDENCEANGYEFYENGSLY